MSPSFQSNSCLREVRARESLNAPAGTEPVSYTHLDVYKRQIPNDPESPFVTSGQRIGTPAVTTRGFGKPEMLHIAEFIWQAATDFDNKADEIRRNVCEICSRFPIY